MSDEESVESDEVLFRDDTILEGSVAEGLVLSAEIDPEGDWVTIGWHERRSVGYWVSMEGHRSVDLSVDAAEKLLPTLADFVRKAKNATTSYWTGAIAAHPKIAQRKHVSSELDDDSGFIILRTEHHALYIKPEELDDAIMVLAAARAHVHAESREEGSRE